tara:strand:+ start:596 stop:829 length:234 start_codon:yes stop_codon:yes gene_type:complete
MNNFTVLLYLVMFAAVVGMTFAFMYTSMRATLDEFYNPSKRKIHPEMKDVKTGDELLVFNANQDDEDDEGDVIIIRK